MGFPPDDDGSRLQKGSPETGRLRKATTEFPLALPHISIAMYIRT